MESTDMGAYKRRMSKSTAIAMHTIHIPTATHIPKSVRGDYARVLADTASAAMDNPVDISQWIHLQIISKCILRAKERGKTQAPQSYAAVVKLASRGSRGSLERGCQGSEK
jgi:hypothetical protein